MKKISSKYEIDMCNGPLFKKILIFSLPLMLTGILQLLYNAADIIVVGRYAGSVSLAAVGSTSSLINLIVNVFVGLSIGTSVVVSQNYGAERNKDVSETVHTSIAISIISGVAVGIFGVIMAKPLLSLMGTPDDVLNLAALYMRIYFAGMPATMVYNFGSAILRAVGDTRRPLYFLSIAGVVNVVLNLFFVIVFNMGVAGVALATVIAQCISVALVIGCLLKAEGSIKLIPKNIKIHKDKLIQIAKIGLPAGIQGSIFAISNVLIQSAVNSFGSIVMAGNAAAANIEGFVYTSMNAIYQTSLTFTGQNMGAKKYRRVNKVFLICTAFVVVVGGALGGLAYFGSKGLLSIYSVDPKVIEMGMLRMSIICTTYFLCGFMDVLVGSLRGMGKSILPMLVTILGVCGIRILWIYTVFAQHRTLTTLYISYPISWMVTAAIHLICYIVVVRKLVGNTSEVSIN